MKLMPLPPTSTDVEAQVQARFRYDRWVLCTVTVFLFFTAIGVDTGLIALVHHYLSGVVPQTVGSAVCGVTFAVWMGCLAEFFDARFSRLKDCKRSSLSMLRCAEADRTSLKAEWRRIAAAHADLTVWESHLLERQGKLWEQETAPTIEDTERLRMSLLERLENLGDA